MMKSGIFLSVEGIALFLLIQKTVRMEKWRIV